MQRSNLGKLSIHFDLVAADATASSMLLRRCEDSSQYEWHICGCGETMWEPQPRDKWAASVEAGCSACHGRRFSVETYSNGKSRITPVKAYDCCYVPISSRLALAHTCPLLSARMSLPEPAPHLMQAIMCKTSGKHLYECRRLLL